jgi:Beta-lactamase
MARVARGIAPGSHPRAARDDLAGALKSSAHDVLTFLAAHLRPPDTPLGRAIRVAQQPHFARDDVRQVGLAWDIDRVFGERVIRHGGETLGYRCFVGFNADRRIAAVVLINSRTDLGQMLTHLIAPHVPLGSRSQSLAFSWLVVALAGLLVTGIKVTSRSDRRRRWLGGFTTAVVVFGWITFLQSRAPSADTVAPFSAPSRLLLIGAPLLAFVVLGVSRVGAQLAEVPLPFLIGVQSFRAILALILQRTYAHSAVPLSPLLDWHLEAVFGVLALVLALRVATHGVGVPVVMAWNWLGCILLLHLLAIASVNPWATQTSLTALPAFIVPVALLGHIVVFRKTRPPVLGGPALGRTRRTNEGVSEHPSKPASGQRGLQCVPVCLVDSLTTAGAAPPGLRPGARVVSLRERWRFSRVPARTTP